MGSSGSKYTPRSASSTPASATGQIQMQSSFASTAGSNFVTGAQLLAERRRVHQQTAGERSQGAESGNEYATPITSDDQDDDSQQVGEQNLQKKKKEKTAEEKEKQEAEEKLKKEAYSDLKAKVDDIWLKVEETVEKEKVELKPVERKGWETIRIFVSSTFRDFHTERDILVKKVFPDLRCWCESEDRRLHLIECDLRWGVPENTPNDETLRVCLGEIDRCYESNKMPYFLNMTSERIGWIPLEAEIKDDIKEKYSFIYGLSVTEMEIMHAAYRKDNPNSLFMVRGEEFLKAIDALKDETEKKEFKTAYVDEYPDIADDKLKTLKSKINDKFKQRKQVRSYECKPVRDSSKTGRPQLQIDDKQFADVVSEFFKQRIAAQYPPVTVTKEDEILRKTGQHDAFMRARAEFVLGQKEILDKISAYVTAGAESRDVPLVIVGAAGSGKSSIMARAVFDFIEKNNETDETIVFYHFVGAVPFSTDLDGMLRRLLKLLTQEEPSDLNDAIQKVRNFLKSLDRRLVIYVDAVNQFDDTDVAVELLTWLPEKLSPRVRCVLSMIDGSKCHENMMKSRETKPEQSKVPELSVDNKKKIVETFLGQFNKKLGAEQMELLLQKKGSCNPLWLTIALEELRVFGDFKKVTGHVKDLADSLEGLVLQVLRRYAKEGESHLLRGTLCLIEVSKSGLLECELLQILADEANLMYPTRSSKKTAGALVSAVHRPRKGFHPAPEPLPSWKWATVYRNLRTFLRPFGEPGEGRLSFYHQTLSNVVRQRYLKEGKAEKSKVKENAKRKKSKGGSPAKAMTSSARRYRWWHRKLADYFYHSTDYDRKVEEYPHHLIALEKFEKLRDFLLDWKAFDKLYNSEHSGALLHYWQTISPDYSAMLPGYSDSLQRLKQLVETNGSKVDDLVDLADKYEKVSRLLVQAGRYDDAAPLAEVSLQIIEKLRAKKTGEDYGSNLMYLYGHMAHLHLQKLPLKQDVSQIPDVEKVIEYHQKAVDILKATPEKYNDKKSQQYLAVQLIKKGFAVGSLVQRIRLKSTIDGDDQFVTQMLDKAKLEADEAAAMCQQLGDIVWVIEAYLTKASLYRGQFGEQHKIYDKAIEKCIQTFGFENPILPRLYFNKAIVFEDEAVKFPDDNSTENYGFAYDYFKMAYTVTRAVFGDQHARTVRYLNQLNEPTYKWFADSRKEKVTAYTMKQVVEAQQKKKK